MDSADILRASNTQLARELADSRQLHDIITELIQERDVQRLYRKLTDAAKLMMRSDMASLQILDPVNDELELRAFSGFGPESAEAWQAISPGSNTCFGVALGTNERVIVGNIDTVALAHEAEAAAFRRLGIGSLQSTPLVARDGKLVGVISTHWRQPYLPEDRELRLIDILARQAADLIGRSQAEKALPNFEEKFRRLVTAASDILYQMSADWREMHLLEGASFLGSTGHPQRTWLETYVPETERSRVEAAIATAIKSKSNFELEHRVIRADGSIGWAFSRAIPWLDERGEISEWFGAATDITRRKEIEVRLRANEQRLRLLADEVPQLVWTNDGTGVADYFNRRWLEYTGLSFEQAFGPGWQAVVHPDDAPASRAKWREALARGKVFDTEYRLRNASGEYRWFIGRNVPLPDEDGRISAWFGTATDIHDLKVAQRAVRDREEYFGRAIEEAPFPVLMQAEDGDILAFSRAWADLSGFRREQGRIESWASAVYGAGGEALRQRMMNVFVENRPADRIELTVAAGDGTLRSWVFSASQPGTLADGRRFAVCIVLDLTDRRQIEKALALSQERLRLIVESANDYAIITLDYERRVTSWNPGAEKLTGFSAEEMVGHLADAIFTPEDRAKKAPEFEVSEAVSKGRSPDERWHLRKDGSRFWGSGVVLPMRSAEQPTPTGFLKIFRDETEKRQAQENLERSRQELELALHEAGVARKEAEAAGHAKDDFLAVLSHELRTPLTPILMAAHMLTRRADLPDPVREALAMIRTHVLLETRLVDDLLDVTRIAKGKMEIERKPVDLHEVIRQAVEVSRPDIDAKDQELTVTYSATTHHLEGDPIRLKQVIWNLLKNASKFTPTRGVIHAETTNERGRFVFRVIDSGIGIERESLTRIFDAFTQADERITREYGGLGLGLSISRAAMLAHGGELRAESQGPGRGATFIASVPLPPT